MVDFILLYDLIILYAFFFRASNIYRTVCDRVVVVFDGSPILFDTQQWRMRHDKDCIQYLKKTNAPK